MELEQFLHALNKPISNFSLDDNHEFLETLYKKYPFSTPLCYLNFAYQQLQNNGNSLNNLSFNQLSIYKSNPLLFAKFYKELKQNKHFNKTIHNVDNDNDILQLINEIPNSNPIKTSSYIKTDDAKNLISDDKKEESLAVFVSTEKDLMVMMSFTDWLLHFKTKSEKEKEEQREKNALKTSWKKEKLTQLSEEEDEDIPDDIFRQAMDSISDNSIISESMAVILTNQGKIDKAIDMYKKLSLQNPEKSAYFADRIKILRKNKDL